MIDFHYSIKINGNHFPKNWILVSVECCGSNYGRSGFWRDCTIMCSAEGFIISGKRTGE